MILYEYVRWVGDQARDTFNHWRPTLQVVERALLDEKVNSLRTAGPETLPGLVAGPIKERGIKYPHILKMQIGGKKFRLRPLLCHGPSAKVEETETDLTLLLGAREIQDRITPSPSVAVDRRETILADFRRRRLYKAEKI